MTNTYFKNLNNTLQNHKRAIPSLLVDLDALDKNTQTLKVSLKKGVDFRIVVKSLPSIELLDYILQKAETQKLMVFHQPFLSAISEHYGSNIDILMGKPMPIKTAAYYYQTLQNQNGFDPSLQLQWLVDTPKRIEEYIDLAKNRGQKIRLNIELNVGLHRGGFEDLEGLKVALSLMVENRQYVEFSGFMGYDPHVVKLPKILRSAKKAFGMANDFYKNCIQLLQNQFPELNTSDLTFNGAGSPTINLHQNPDSVLNDVSAGSCLVKPTTFDIPTLKDYVPACFISTPILKKLKGTAIPSLERIKALLTLFNRSFKNAYFIYGGYWKAEYCYPKGCSENALFGSSTNQTMVNFPANVELEVDDFVFLRPQQSEFVFLQFGRILVFRGGEIIGEWGILEN